MYIQVEVLASLLDDVRAVAMEEFISPLYEILCYKISLSMLGIFSRPLFLDVYVNWGLVTQTKGLCLCTLVFYYGNLSSPAIAPALNAQSIIINNKKICGVCTFMLTIT